MPVKHDGSVDRWSRYRRRYESGEWRAVVFRDMILDDARELGNGGKDLTFLDIGCGDGFDADKRLQESLAKAAGRYIGVEPDTGVKVGGIFDVVHPTFFEDAPIEEESIDLAFAVMVMEHFENPGRFFDKLHGILRPGGVFWGFTVDIRHWFALGSLVTEKLGVKDWYLDRLHGGKGGGRYENYPVHYRANTPAGIRKLAGRFSRAEVINFSKVGQLDFYFPKSLRWAGRALDRAAMSLGLPGSILAVRLAK